jgi:energy-coupling factor transporter ATP-binding protein EcfA2
MSQSPFKFLDSYTKEDKDIFFGREAEVEDVYTKVFQGKILLVYGASGTGKSSLISCGLANKFQDSDWLPVEIRRGMDINDSVRQQLEKKMLTPVASSKNISIPKLLKSIYLDHFKPIFLVFDQFEELFIFGDRDEWEKFIKTVREVIDSDLQVRFIFIVRGEYLEYLTDFEETLPEIFSNRIRIEKMTRANAVRCVTGPCQTAGIIVEDHFPENLLTKLSPSKTEIELTYLQVFLDRIYKKAQGQGNGEITFSNKLLDELGNVGDVLSQFLDEQIELIPDSEKALSLLKAFVSTDATKKQVTIQQVSDFLRTIGQDLDEKEIDRIIQELVNRRILKDKNETDQYELRHDSIAAKIFEKITSYERDLIEVNQFILYAFGEHEKRGFQLNESDLAYIAPYENRLNLTPKIQEFISRSKAIVEKSKQSRKRIVITAIVMSVFLAIALVAVVFAFVQQTAARAAERNALTQKEIAEDQKIQAEEQRKNAEQQKEEANRQAQIAQEQSAIALAQRKEAERQRELSNQLQLKAEAGQQSALDEKAKADAANLEAQRQAQLAEKNAMEANKAKEEATRFRMLAIAQAMGVKAGQLQDKDQKVLVAQQAYLFNKQYNGYEYQADIYKGLHSAFAAAYGEKFNAVSVHNGMIKGMVYLNENIVITAGADGKIMKTNLSTSPPQVTLVDSKPYVFQSIAISRDKETLALGTDEGKLLLYDVNSSKLIKELFVCQSSIWALEFGNKGTLFSGCDRAITMWNLKDFSSLKIYDAPSSINSLSTDSKTNSLVAGLSNGVILSADISNVQNIKWNFLLAAPDPNPEQKYLMTYWGAFMPDESLRGKFAMSSITKLKFNSLGNLLAIGRQDGTILLIEARGHGLLINSEMSRTFNGHKAMINDVQFSADDKFLLSASADGSSMLWNLEAVNQQQVTFDSHGGWVFQAGFNSTGSEIITADATGSIRHFPVRMDFYASKLCSSVNRNLSEIEWKNFVGDDVPYSKTCDR